MSPSSDHFSRDEYITTDWNRAVVPRASPNILLAEIPEDNSFDASAMNVSSADVRRMDAPESENMTFYSEKPDLPKDAAPTGKDEARDSS